MTALDIRARETARALLLRYGKVCTLKKLTNGTYDPETGTVTQTSVDHTVHVYLDMPNRTELASGLVSASDEIAIFAASEIAVAPVLGDMLTVDSRNRLIKMVSKVWSGDQVALWRIGIVS